jgi:ferredoxin
MTYVVTDKCINCKYAECVASCPVNCFYEGRNFMAINPEECIDCGKCVTECPVEAIYPDHAIPSELSSFIELNQRLSKVWPKAHSNSEKLAEADKWSGTTNKLEYLLTD